MAEGNAGGCITPSGVSGRGIGNNSIQCTSCQKWVHKKYRGIKGSMYKVTNQEVIININIHKADLTCTFGFLADTDGELANVTAMGQ